MTIGEWYAGIFRTNPSAPLVEWALGNTDFRRVIYTTPRKQWVLMSIPAGSSVGEERHRRVRQTFYFVGGHAVAVVDGRRRVVGPGDVVTVHPNSTHNFITYGKEPLKLYTTYEPPNHIDGRVQKTKLAAARDVEDEAFGQRVDRGRSK